MTYNEVVVVGGGMDDTGSNFLYLPLFSIVTIVFNANAREE